MLSSLVHSVLYKRRKVADTEDGDDASNEEQIVSSAEAMLHSLVERMVKCEPEDFELVLLSVSFSFYITGIFSVVIRLGHIQRSFQQNLQKLLERDFSDRMIFLSPNE